MPARDTATEGVSLGSAFTVAHTVPGRLRLKLPHPHPAALLDAARVALTPLAGVRDVRVNSGARSLVIEYDPRTVAQAALLGTGLEHGSAAPADMGDYKDAVEASLVVDGSRAAVWRVLGDPVFAALHAPGTVQITGVADGGWSARIEVLGKTIDARIAVAESVPEERLVLRIDGRLRARLTTTLSPAGTGTRLRERLEYSLPGSFIGTAVSRLAARPRLREELAEHLERIARAAGTGATTGAP